MFREKWIKRSPNFKYQSLFDIKNIHPKIYTEEPIMKDFVFCIMFGYHRCLPEKLWDTFKISINENLNTFKNVKIIIKKLKDVFEDNIETLISDDSADYECNINYADNIGYLTSYITKLFSNSQDAKKIIFSLFQYNLKISSRINIDFWHMFGISGEYIPKNFYDISIKLPTGYLTLGRSIYVPGRRGGYSCEFLPNIYHSDLNSILSDLEFCEIKKYKYFYDDIIKLVEEYSMDEYQLLCRYIEWEKINDFY